MVAYQRWSPREVWCSGNIFPSILLSLKGKAIERLKFVIDEKWYQEFIHPVFIQLNRNSDNSFSRAVNNTPNVASMCNANERLKSWNWKFSHINFIIYFKTNAPQEKEKKNSVVSNFDCLLVLKYMLLWLRGLDIWRFNGSKQRKENRVDISNNI